MLVEQLSLDTAIYKYLSLESFIAFLAKRQLVFSRLDRWPDSFEGGFYSLIAQNDDLPKRDRFFGSSWSLQKESDYIFPDDAHRRKKSSEELEKRGSAAMWESYCKNGGVRIKTTIGKVLALYSDSMMHGRVFYAPASLPPSLSDKKDYLFHKRTCFHYENEYRFLFEKNDHQSPIVLLEVESLRDFIDEFLVCPSTKERQWISEAIYALLQQCDFFSVITENNRSENRKNGIQYCGISQLYGQISQELL